MKQSERVAAFLLAFAITISNCPVQALAVGSDALANAQETDGTWSAPVSEGTDADNLAAVEILPTETEAQTALSQGTTAATEDEAQPTADIVASGTCGTEGDNLTWVLDADGVFTVSGTGAMTNYSSGVAMPWNSYKSRIKTLVLSEGITTIGRCAFYGCAITGQLELPESLVEIKDYAFYGVSGITGQLVIPDGVTYIGSYAFRDCSKLTGDLVIPSGVTTINTQTFYGCSGLNGVLILPTGLTSLGNMSFYSCSKLTGDLEIPDSVTRIYDNAFYGCKGFTGLHIGIQVTDIGAYAFYNCSGLSGSLLIPDSVKSIGNYAFYSCKEISKLQFGAAVTTIGANSFAECTSAKEVTFLGTAVPSVGSNIFASMAGLTVVYVPVDALSEYRIAFQHQISAAARMIPFDVTEDFLIKDGVLIAYLGDNGVVAIPDEVSAIGDYAFCNYQGLTEIFFPDGVLSVGDYAFQNCSGLQTMTISDEVTCIGTYAFGGCSSLSGEIPLPSNLTTLGDNAFNGCASLIGDLHIPETVTSLGTGVFQGCSGLNGDLVIPEGITVIGSGTFMNCTALTGSLTIPETVTSIGDYAFQNCKSLTGSLVIPEAITSLGIGTFQGCTGLNGELVIPEGITVIGGMTFMNCTGLTGSLTIPETVTSIGNYAFQNCKNLTGRLIIPEGVATIESYAFQGCSGFTGELLIPETVTEISAYTFSGCTGLTGDLTIPASIKSVGNSAFYACDGLDGTLAIKAGVETIGTNAFYKCTGLSALELGYGLNSIGNSAFYGCSGLSGGLIIPDTVASIGREAFTGCKRLTSLKLGNGLTKIENSTFYNCKGLTGELVIPDGITYIGGSAFEACSAFTKLILGSGLQTIYNSAFYNCTGLTGDLTIPNSVTTLGTYAFCNCSGLNGKITLPAGLKIIPESAFSGCENVIGTLLIPDSVTTIRNSAFSGMSSIEEIVIGTGVTKINEDSRQSAFYQCTTVKRVVFKGETPPTGYIYTGIDFFDSMTSLEQVCVPASAFEAYAAAYQAKLPRTARFYVDGTEDEFYVEGGKLIAYQGAGGEVVIPEGISAIGYSAFQNCSAMTSIQIPDAVTEIRPYAFKNCIGLAGSLVIPDGVAAINQGTFSGVSGITSMEFGTSVSSIYTDANDATHALYGLIGITELTFHGTTPPTLTSSTYGPFAFMPNLTTVYVPVEALGAYTEAFGSYLPDTAKILPIGVEGEFQIVDGVLIAYLGEGGEVVIPDTVTAIGNAVFMNCTTLTKVSIPESVTSIGSYAFSGCTGLTELMLPSNLTTIGDYAFNDCTGLACGLTVPNSVTTIGSYAFHGCVGLTGALVIPNLVSSIGDHAFENCSSLTGELDLSSGITHIGEYAFNGCTGFTGSLNLPEDLTELGAYAFCSCRGFSGELVIPNGVTRIAAGTFSGLSQITSITIGAGVSSIYTCSNTQSHPAYQMTGVTELSFAGATPPAFTNSTYAFFSNMSKLTVIYVPEASFETYVTAFSSYLGSNIRLMASDSESDFLIQDGILVGYLGKGGEVVIPDGVTSIGKHAFRNCKTVTKVTFPDSLINIGDYAFCNTTGMTGTLVIPGSVVTIGDSAFSSCRAAGLELGYGIQTIGVSAFSNCSKLTGDLSIPDSVTSIGRNAFYYCDGLNGTLTLSNNMTQIEAGTFLYCSRITGEVVIPDCVTFVGNLSFGYMSSITSIVVGKNVETIANGGYSDQKAFNKCTSVKSITFKSESPPSGQYIESLTSLETVFVPQESYSDYVLAFYSKISANARFSCHDSIEEMYIRDGVLIAYFGPGGEVEIPDSVTAIGPGAFFRCEDLTKVTIPEGLTMMDVVSFKECANLAEVNLPDTLREIGAYAFCGCTSLTSICLPSELEEIGTGSFQNCVGLTGDLEIPGKVTSFGNSAFYGCTHLTGLILYDGLTSIPIYAFSNCTGLSGNLVIPDSVTAVGNYAFYGCTGFDGMLMLPDNLTSIGYYAFSGCSGFTGELVIPDMVTKLEQAAFSGMSGITSVVFGTGLTSIYTYSSNLHSLYGMSNVTEVTFTGAEVPTLTATSVSPFAYMPELATIYVPVDSYDAYVSAYSKYVGESVVFSADLMQAKLAGLAVTQTYSRTVVLSWNSHICDKVVGYRIYRNGELVGDTAELTYTDRQLTTGETYTYQVMGYGESGRVTPAAEVKATPVNPTIYNVEVDYKELNKVNAEKHNLYVYAANDKNLEPLGEECTTGCFYYMKNGSRVFIAEATLDKEATDSATAKFVLDWDISTFQDGTYDLVFVMKDVDGGSAEYTKTVTIDRSVPAKIVGLTAIGAESSIVLTWSIAKEIDTGIYRIYRRGENEAGFKLLTQVNGRNTLEYTDTTVTEDVAYFYYVVGVNDMNLEGEASDVAGATLSGDTEPPQVTKLTPSSGTYLSGTVTLGMKAQDNISVTRGEFYYSLDGGLTWTQIAEVLPGNMTTSLDTTTLPDGKLRVKGVAYDAKGNQGALTNDFCIDNTGPEQVQDLSYESTSVTVTLRWKDVADQDIGAYQVERKNADGLFVLVATVTDTLGANLYNLAPDSQYTYRVVGYDIHGNRGMPSEEITVQTKSDTTAPVIAKIRPVSGYYATEVSLTVVAEDEYNVASIVLETSIDGLIWTEAHRENYNTVQKSRTMAYTLPLTDCQEGKLFVRAVTTDTAGNQSDTGSSAPYIQIVVDRTSPAAPAEVAATGGGGYVEVTWKQGEETDLDAYSVYRANTAGGAYTQVANGLYTVNYVDRDVEEGETYYYKVSVCDLAGNESDASQAVSAIALRDTQPPEVISVYPKTGSSLGVGYKMIRILAKDNSALSTIQVDYSSDGVSFAKLELLENIGAYNATFDVEIPVERFSHNAVVYIRATATDATGNVSEGVDVQYVVDSEAPGLENLKATYVEGDDSGYVQISWTGLQESDLAGYRVYRKTGTTGSYHLIAQRQAADSSYYSCEDYQVSVTQTTYYYKVEAVDLCGNVYTEACGPVGLPEMGTLVPVISCSPVLQAEVEYVIDGSTSTGDSAILTYAFDFGDGTTSGEMSPVHSYAMAGSYTITLTVTDDEGHTATCEKNVTVVERASMGTAKIRVVDEDGVPVPGAPVYFDLGEETQVVQSSDSSGYVTFEALAGKHTVGCVIANNEWLPTKKDIIVTSQNETAVTLTLVRHVMVEGQFEIKRMTFEEIVAAGIDVSLPENQHVTQVRTTLVYGSQDIEIMFYANSDGIINGNRIVSTSGGSREIIPWVYNEAMIAFLDIPVGVSALKEFFDVRLHIINHASSEFSVMDNTVELHVPDGLTLVETEGTAESAAVCIPEIPGQTTETVTWILRGDQVGEYFLTADYSGILSEFDEPVYTRFESQEPIQVYGLSNLKLKIELADALDHGTLYYNVSVTNEGRVDMYRPRIATDDVIIETELFDVTGADITDTVTLPADAVKELTLVEAVGSDLDVLVAGQRLTRHYMCLDALYTEVERELWDILRDAQNTYGMEVDLVKKDVSYFTSNLNASINALDKANLTLSTRSGAFEYVMGNKNFAYWNLFAYTDGAATEQNSITQREIWAMMDTSKAAGEVDFSVPLGQEDAQCKAVILELLEDMVENEVYSGYYDIRDWLSALAAYANGSGKTAWSTAAADWVSQTAVDATEEERAALTEAYSNSLPQALKLVTEKFMWEVYKAITQDQNLAFDRFVISKWKTVLSENYPGLNSAFDDAQLAQLLHKFYGLEGMSEVWEKTGISPETAGRIVLASEDAGMDVTMFLVAHSNLEGCKLFLDTLSAYVPAEGSDGAAVSEAARELRQELEALDPVETLLDTSLDEAFWMSVGYSKQTALEELGITYAALVYAMKMACHSPDSELAGDSVFNAADRQEAINNLRILSYITQSLRSGILDTRAAFIDSPKDATAEPYMRLISYLLDVRAAGESQLAFFGVSYEPVPDPDGELQEDGTVVRIPWSIDDQLLLEKISALTGVSSGSRWILWRNGVEDRISRLRAQLLRNPLAEEASDYTFPEATFDYRLASTVQSFSEEYEQSTDGGVTWTPCGGEPISVNFVSDLYGSRFVSDGKAIISWSAGIPGAVRPCAESAITVEPQSSFVELQIRRVDCSDTQEKMTTAILVYSAPTLTDSGIYVLQTEAGYQVENLDASRSYELALTKEQQSFGYGESLSIPIPENSQAYVYETDEEFDYAYIRSVADENRFASYVYSPVIHRMCRLNVTTVGQGTVTGVGAYPYGADATLTATAAENFRFDGWYENGDLISPEPRISLKMISDRNLEARFIQCEGTISVEIAWGNMEFTYTGGIWNPNTHTYEGAEWSDGGSGYVTVTNTGTADTTAAFSYQTERSDIQGSFTDGTSFVILEVPLEVGNCKTIFLRLSGKPDSELNNDVIGTVTVRIGGE